MTNLGLIITVAILVLVFALIYRTVLNSIFKRKTRETEEEYLGELRLNFIERLYSAAAAASLSLILLISSFLIIGLLEALFAL